MSTRKRYSVGIQQHRKADVDRWNWFSMAAAACSLLAAGSKTRQMEVRCGVDELAYAFNPALVHRSLQTPMLADCVMSSIWRLVATSKRAWRRTLS
jgi:hypothetical protein